MPHYRKKPVVIEAREWDGSNAVDLLAWIGEAAEQDGQTLLIHTLEGTHEASLGDFIICGVKGEFYPCKPDIFAATYDTAEVTLGTINRAVITLTDDGEDGVKINLTFEPNLTDCPSHDLAARTLLFLRGQHEGDGEPEMKLNVTRA